MKQRIIILLGIVAVLLLLVFLNVVSYVRQDEVPDRESRPKRSSYNPGATGTKAYYEILAATKRNVVRWQKPVQALKSSDVGTFIIVGPLLIRFEEGEIIELLEWVSKGNKLVLIHRNPHPDLLITTTPHWDLKLEENEERIEIFEVSPYRPEEMIRGVPVVAPAYPTLFTANVNAIQPSQFASKLIVEKNTKKEEFSIVSKLKAKRKEDEFEEFFELDTERSPIVHFADSNGAILTSMQFGNGEIVYLSDPYIVSNGGIRLADNVQLAINIADSQKTIAFDEYHHGYGSAESALISYLQKTPFLAIVAQIALLTVAILFSQSRRFTRPLPVPQPSRLSKLEYITAVAELQQRANAYDLAVENIYSEFRRRISILLGIDASRMKPEDLAERIGMKGNLDVEEIKNLLVRCQNIIYGEQTNRREAMSLIKQLRELEQKLGMKRSGLRTKV